MSRRFIPNLDNHLYLETFFVSAVCGLLGVRFYLYVTGFPQVGGNGLHIAHMIWGGVLMVAAIVLLLTYFGRFIRRLAAILGGAGFGIFIDEVGKFLTSNNNYFFKPAAAIIYVAFLLLFTAIYFLLRQHSQARSSQMVLALQGVVEAVAQEFDRPALHRIREHLRQCAGDDAMTMAVESLVREMHARPEPKPGLLVRVSSRIDRLYESCLETSLFRRGIIVAFSAWAVAHLAIDAISLAGPIHSRSIHGDISLPASSIAVAVLTLISAGLIVAGDVTLLRSRLQSYGLFKYAMLVSIFLTTDFQFYRVQFFALIGLAQAVIGLVVANALIQQEQRHLRRKWHGIASTQQI
jgi:hypothetical protein